uniref:Uncharacterized protein n=1 Tax=Cuerna arida TaxID=1464854 RepID=A0A1B6FJV5_9HEMI
MAKIYNLLTLTLLMGAFVSAFPVENDSHNLSFEEEHEDPIYEEDPQDHQEDYADLKDSGEALNENLIMDRRWTSLENIENVNTLEGEEVVFNNQDEGKIQEDVPQEDMLYDETVTFTAGLNGMP